MHSQIMRDLWKSSEKTLRKIEEYTNIKKIKENVFKNLD